MSRRRTLARARFWLLAVLPLAAGCQHDGAPGGPAALSDGPMMVRTSPITYAIPAGIVAGQPTPPGTVAAVPVATPAAAGRRRHPPPLPPLPPSPAPVFLHAITVPMYVAPVYRPVVDEPRR